MDKLKTQYPDRFSDIQYNQIDLVYDRILRANLVWSNALNDSKTPVSSGVSMVNRTTPVSKTNDSLTLSKENYIAHLDDNKLNETLFDTTTMGIRFTSFLPHQRVEDKNVLKTVGFIFHKISLTISVMLVLWVSNKNIQI